MLKLEDKIEAMLFFLGESVPVKRLAQITKSKKEEVLAAINTLEKRLTGSGLTLVKNGEEVMLGTHKDASNLIEEIIKDEQSRDLSKASLETVAIILYKGPISKKEIDYIRGVNSAFTLRNLLIRGLIERAEVSSDDRSYFYRPTIDLLRFLGISQISELPEFEDFQKRLEEFAKKEESLIKESDESR